MFDKFKRRKEEQVSLKNEKVKEKQYNGGFSDDMLSSNEYSSSNFIYEKFAQKNKDFKPLFLIGRFSIKMQYLIALTISSVGLVGSYFIYDHYQKTEEKIRLVKNELYKLDKDTEIKKVYLNNFKEINEELSTEQLFSKVGKRSAFNNADEIDGELKSLDLEGAEVFELVEDIKKIQNFYQSHIDLFIKDNVEINNLVKSNINLLQNVNQSIEAILSNKKLSPYLVDSQQKKELLNEIFIEVKNLLLWLNNKNGIDNIKTNYKNITYQINLKNKEIEKLLRNFNDLKWNINNVQALNFINKNAKQVNENINQFFVEHKKLNTKISSYRVNNEYKNVFNTLSNNIERVQLLVKEKQTANLNNFKNIYITLIIFLLGLSLILLIRSKTIEYNKQISISMLNDVLKNINEIEKDIDIYMTNRNHKISSHKSKRVMRLVDSINVMWDKYKNTFTNTKTTLTKLEKSENNDNTIIGLIKKIEEDTDKINNNSLEELVTIDKIIASNNEIGDYYSNNILNINQKNNELNDFIINIPINLNKLTEESKKLTEKIKNLIKIGGQLKDVAVETKSLSEEAKVLSFNADIISKQQSGGNAFIEISNKLGSISDKYTKVSEDINFITDNVIKTFETIDINVNKIELELDKNANKAEMLKNKHVVLKAVEDKIKEAREKLDENFSELKLSSLRENMMAISENTKEVKKNIESYEFNFFVKMDLISEIKNSTKLNKEDKK